MVTFLTTVKAHLVCQSRLKDGKVCGRTGIYQSTSEREAMRLAAEDGWTNRIGVARCRQCEEDGLPYGQDTVAPPKPCPRGKCDGSGWVYEDKTNIHTGKVESVRFQCECRAAEEWVGGA